MQSIADFRRQMRPPNKKKYEGEMEDIAAQIRLKENEMVSERLYTGGKICALFI